MSIAPARRAAVVVSAALVAILLGGAPAALAAGDSQPVSVKVPWTGTITAYGPDGNPLPHNPKLHRGDTVSFAITKLSPDEQVSVTLHSSNRNLGLVHVADDGTTSYDLTVPNDLAFGAHTITFTGVVSDAAPKFGFTVVSAGGGGGNGGSGGSGGGSNGNPGGSGGEHGLASTGADVVGLLIVAGGLIGVGLVLMLVSFGCGRRPA